MKITFATLSLLFLNLTASTAAFAESCAGPGIENSIFTIGTPMTSSEYTGLGNEILYPPIGAPSATVSKTKKPQPTPPASDPDIDWQGRKVVRPVLNQGNCSVVPSLGYSLSEFGGPATQTESQYIGNALVAQSPWLYGVKVKDSTGTCYYVMTTNLPDGCTY